MDDKRRFSFYFESKWTCRFRPLCSMLNEPRDSSCSHRRYVGLQKKWNMMSRIIVHGITLKKGRKKLINRMMGNIEGLDLRIMLVTCCGIQHSSQSSVTLPFPEYQMLRLLCIQVCKNVIIQYLESFENQKNSESLVFLFALGSDWLSSSTVIDRMNKFRLLQDHTFRQ